MELCPSYDYDHCTTPQYPTTCPILDLSYQAVCHRWICYPIPGPNPPGPNPPGPQPPDPSPSPLDQSGLSGGAIAGIVIGLLLLTLGAFLWYFGQQARRRLEGRGRRRFDYRHNARPNLFDFSDDETTELNRPLTDVLPLRNLQNSIQTRPPQPKVTLQHHVDQIQAPANVRPTSQATLVLRARQPLMSVSEANVRFPSYSEHVPRNQMGKQIRTVFEQLNEPHCFKISQVPVDPTTSSVPGASNHQIMTPALVTNATRSPSTSNVATMDSSTSAPKELNALVLVPTLATISTETFSVSKSAPLDSNAIHVTGDDPDTILAPDTTALPSPQSARTQFHPSIHSTPVVYSTDSDDGSCQTMTDSGSCQTTIQKIDSELSEFESDGMFQGRDLAEMKKGPKKKNKSIKKGKKRDNRKNDKTQDDNSSGSENGKTDKKAKHSIAKNSSDHTQNSVIKENSASSSGQATKIDRQATKIDGEATKMETEITTGTSIAKKKRIRKDYGPPTRQSKRILDRN